MYTALFALYVLVTALKPARAPVIWAGAFCLQGPNSSGRSYRDCLAMVISKESIGNRNTIEGHTCNSFDQHGDMQWVYEFPSVAAGYSATLYHNHPFWLNQLECWVWGDL
jgi:hypothetical protein